MDVFEQRFSGISRLYGQQVTTIIKQTHVLVIGVGGVGSWAAEALARSGFGQISLIDYDDIVASNINRQIHSTTTTLDLSKVDVMKERILSINPLCQVNNIDDRVSESNCDKFFCKENGLLKNIDYVIDAIDSVKAKTALLSYCVQHKVPIVTTGGAGGLSDPTSVSYCDLSKTYNDALAAKIRYNLRAKYGFSRNSKKKFNIECVFSTEQPMYPQEDGSVSLQKPQLKGETLDCQTGYGSSTLVTATFGFVTVARVVEKIKKKVVLIHT